MTEQSESLRELEELMALAEKTSARTLEIRREIKTLRDRLLVSLLLIYIALATGAAMTLWFKDKLPLQLGTLTLVIAAIFVGYTAILFAKQLADSKERAQRMRKELKVEEEINLKLTNMIYDQMSLVFSNDEVSIVTKAVFEMKLKRLQLN